MTKNDINKSDLLACTTDIVAAYVAGNTLPAAELPNLITQIYITLTNITDGVVSEQSVNKSEPAVPIKKSITNDYLICLEDGKKMKMLKRHLKTAYGLTPEQYRARWNLPHDYPMVAPNYAEKRSSLAKTFGLGQQRDGAKRKSKPKAK